MRRWIASLMTVMVFMVLTACGSSYTAGTYQGEAKGYSPDANIKVSVTIGEDGKIADVKVDSHSETEELGGTALVTLAQQAVEKNSPDVDTIAGATITTDGFKEAMKQALDQAK
ncbi:MAG: FMN-binding protein [Tissierellia bacterium]|nr:FMN-binding protein [Tissierellia bacterium]